MGKLIDLTNKRFGKLLVKGLAGGSRGGSRLWNCVCDCGNFKLVSTRHLNRKKNNVRSCGCENNNSKMGKNSPYFKGFGDISGSFFNRHINKSAKRRTYKGKEYGREIPVTINVEYLDSIWQNQKGRCAYTGEEITLPKKWDDKTYTASVDRIDSEKGYIEGNIQFVHQSVNLMKNRLTHDFFLEMCKKIVNNIN